MQNWRDVFKNIQDIYRSRLSKSSDTDRLGAADGRSFDMSGSSHVWGSFGEQLRRGKCDDQARPNPENYISLPQCNRARPLYFVECGPIVFR
jgi:hypothetical protein